MMTADMLQYLFVGISAFFVSGLTLFSGFGLGTLLLPVFALFFPVDVAVAATAVVHFLNNLFKLYLLGTYADRSTVIRFGVPAFFSAFLGARSLLWLSDLEPVIRYQLTGREFTIMPVKIVIAILMFFFALWETVPMLKNIRFEKRYLVLGGVLSGFFGGLSGHQGAMRSAFLLKCGLSKEAFIATGVVIACVVDLSRISTYGLTMMGEIKSESLLLATAVLSAFSGAFAARRLLRNVTMRTVRLIVTVLLLLIAIGLGMGII